MYGCFTALNTDYDVHKNAELHNVQQKAEKIIK